MSAPQNRFRNGTSRVPYDNVAVAMTGWRVGRCVLRLLFPHPRFAEPAYGWTSPLPGEGWFVGKGLDPFRPPMSMITHGSADWRCNTPLSKKISGTSNLALRVSFGTAWQPSPTGFFRDGMATVPYGFLSGRRGNRPLRASVGETVCREFRAKITPLILR